MEKLVFNIDIKAPKEKIWKILWDDETYRKWTSSFCGESYVQTSWNEGDKIYFLGEGGAGMNSLIESKIPNEYMAFKHMGELKDFKEVPPNEETQKWVGAILKKLSQKDWRLLKSCLRSRKCRRKKKEEERGKSRF